MEKAIDFLIKYWYVFVAVVAVLVIAMIASLGVMIYGQSLHVDVDEIDGVYGMNGKRNTKITFDNTTTEAVIEVLDGMKYQGSEKGSSSSYETYVCVKMVNGDEYRIKYCDDGNVYITGGSARSGRYINSKNDEAMSNIIKIVKALERNNGKDSESNSSAAGSAASSSAASTDSDSQSLTVSVNSVEQ